MIQNPILPGFCPDPSIIRVGEDYYIANSSFEWWPGVKIYHSKDLKHYEQLPSPLNRMSQLNMVGEGDSCGVWAPDISWDGEYFWLIYTDVKTRTGGLFNTHNYLVKSKDIRGGWSEPVYLNSSGFDPSVFHDTDGKMYIVNMINNFKGILVQEYDPVQECLVGEAKNVFPGTGRGYTEGPHIYHIGEYYYLLMAEGGTGYDHMVTMARSKSLWGPYEEDPGNPVLTSDMENPDELQRCGHADIVCTQNGEWYMVHLCGRPPKGSRQCVLGRETAIQKMVWNEEGWLRMACGGNFGQWETEEPTGIPEYLFPKEEGKDYGRDDFDLEIADSVENNEIAKNADIAGTLSQTKEYLNENNAVGEDGDKKLSMPEKKTSALLDVRYTSLRQPYDSYTSLTERPGYLRLYGQESLNSCYNVSLVARRQQDRYVQVETCVEFAPTCREQMAGLAYMYDTGNFYLLVKNREEEFGSQTLDLKKPAKLRLIKSDHFDVEDVIPAISIPEEGPVYLRVTTTQEGLYAKIFYSLDGKDYQELAEVPTNILTDEQSDGFTGAHFGMYCHDMTGVRRYADFDYFEIVKTRKEQ